MISEVIRQMSNNNFITESKNETNERNESQLDVKSSKSAKEYSAVSKDGDTLEIGVEGDIVKISDASLRNCSKQKLNQLLHNGKISKQQYDKVVKSMNPK